MENERPQLGAASAVLGRIQSEEDRPCESVAVDGTWRKRWKGECGKAGMAPAADGGGCREVRGLNPGSNDFPNEVCGNVRLLSGILLSS